MADLELNKIIEELKKATQDLKEIFEMKDLDDKSALLLSKLKAIETLFTSLNKLEEKSQANMLNLTKRQKAWTDEAKKTKKAIEEALLANADKRISKMKGIDYEEQRATNEMVGQLRLLQKIGDKETASLATNKLRTYYTNVWTKQFSTVLKMAKQFTSEEGAKKGLGDFAESFFNRGMGMIVGGLQAGGAGAIMSVMGGALSILGAAYFYGLAQSLAQLKDRVAGYTTIIGSSTKSSYEVSKQAKFYSSTLAKASYDFAMNTEEVRSAHSTLAQNLMVESEDFFNTMKSGTKSLGGIRRYATAFGLSYDDATQASILLTNTQRKLVGAKKAEEAATKDSIYLFSNLRYAAKKTGIALPALEKAARNAVSSTNEYTTSAESVSRMMTMLLTQKSPVAPATAEQAASDVAAITSAIRSMPLTAKMLAMPQAGLGAGVEMMGLDPMQLLEKFRGLMGGKLMFSEADSPAIKQLKMLIASSVTGIRNDRMLYQMLDRKSSETAKKDLMQFEHDKQVMMNADKYQKDTQQFVISAVRAFYSLLTQMNNYLAVIAGG